MKKLFTIIAVMLVLCCTACNNSQGFDGNEQITIRIAHASAEDATTQKVCEAFKEKLESLVGVDKVNVEIYPNATLGSEAEMVEAIQMGTLEAATLGRHSAIDSRLDVLNLPFLFKDDDHAKKVLRGDEGREIREVLDSIMNEHDIECLGWYETGFREITSHEKITSLNDLKGLLIRTPSTATLLKSFESWGASPTAVDLSELYSALQSKVVDAQENPYQLIYSSKLYEVQEYLCVSNHLTIPNQLIFSKKLFDKYPEDIQNAIKEAGAYACDIGGETNIKLNNSLIEELGKYMDITYMDDKSIDEMIKISKETVWPQFVAYDNETGNLIDKINEIN